MADADVLIGYENELAGQEAKLALAIEAKDGRDEKYRRERIAAIEAAIKTARSGAVEVEVEERETASLRATETATIDEPKRKK